MKEEDIIKFSDSLKGLGTNKKGVALILRNPIKITEDSAVQGVIIDNKPDRKEGIDRLDYIVYDRENGMHRSPATEGNFDQEVPYHILSRFEDLMDCGKLIPVVFEDSVNPFSTDITFKHNDPLKNDKKAFWNYPLDKEQFEASSSVRFYKSVLAPRNFSESNTFNCKTEEASLYFAVENARRLSKRGSAVRDFRNKDIWTVSLDNADESKPLDVETAEFFATKSIRSSILNMGDTKVFQALFDSKKNAIAFASDYANWMTKAEIAVGKLLGFNIPSNIQDQGMDLLGGDKKYIDCYLQKNFYTEEFQERPFGELLDNTLKWIREYGANPDEENIKAVSESLDKIAFDKYVVEGIHLDYFFQEPITLDDGRKIVGFGKNLGKDNVTWAAKAYTTNADNTAVEKVDFKDLPHDGLKKAIEKLDSPYHPHIDFGDKKLNVYKMDRVAYSLYQRISNVGAKSFTPSEASQAELFFKQLPEEIRQPMAVYLENLVRKNINEKEVSLPEKWFTSAFEELEKIAKDGLPIKYNLKHADYEMTALAGGIDSIKLLTVVRRLVRGKYKYYLQITIKGKKPQKGRELGSGKVGIDLGASTIAVCGDNIVSIDKLAAKCDYIQKDVKKIQRKMDRSRRANNPDNYNENGAIKKGKKLVWKNSNRYKALCKQYAEIKRKQAAVRKIEHIERANNLLKEGNIFITEKNPIKEWAKKSEETEINPKTGKTKSKKKYGKSISVHAPGMFIEILKNKVVSLGGKFIKDNPENAASEYDFTNDTFTDHGFDRTITLSNGDKHQRDTLAAFNIKNRKYDEEEPKQYNREQMQKEYARFCELEREEIEKYKNGTKKDYRRTIAAYKLY